MDINLECAAIFEEIEALRKQLFKGSLRKLAKDVYFEQSIDDGNNESEDDKKDALYCDRLKKIWRRKSWNESKARPGTLNLLKDVQKTIYKLDVYKDSELKDGSLTAAQRQMIRDASKDLDEFLRKERLMNDYEE